MKKIIGVVGLSGSGKTEFSKMLAEALHLTYVSVDKLSKECYSKKTVINKIKNAFGASVFDNGKLNTKKLGSIVFASKKHMNTLTEITYPYAESALKKIISAAKQGCVLEWVKLNETPFFKQCTFTILIERNFELRVGSLVKRDNVDANYIKLRDTGICYNKQNFDLIVKNNSTLTALTQKVAIAASRQFSNIALYAGMFDPLTNGHLQLIKQACNEFDFVIVGMGNNKNKKRTFNKQLMCAAINESLRLHQLNNAWCTCYNGLTGKFAQLVNAKTLVRGIRNIRDTVYEQQMCAFNEKHFNLSTKFYEVENFKNISSTAVKTMLKNNEDVSQLVPSCVLKLLNNEMKK